MVVAVNSSSIRGVGRFAHGQGKPRALLPAPQGSAQFVSELHTQFGPHEPTDRDAPALARELDERSVAMARLDSHPDRLELDSLGASAACVLDGQSTVAQRNVLAIVRVSRMNRGRGGEGRQLDAGKRKHQRRTLAPEGRGDAQREQAKRSKDL